MEDVRVRANRVLTAFLLVAAMVLVFAALMPGQVHAKASAGHAVGAAQEQAAQGVGIKEIWYDEMSGSYLRQPASGGRYAWLAWVDPYDYYEDPSFYLYERVKASDFMLQMKVPGGEWTDVAGKNLAVVGDNQVWSPYEATIAALVPDNTEPVTKNWRVVYTPGGVASEVISQAPKLATTDSIQVSDYWSCTYFDVAPLPWSYEQYQKDHIPPIYLAYIDPNIRFQMNDNGLVAKDPDAHRICAPFAYGSMPLTSEGRQFDPDYLYTMSVNIKLHDEETPSDSEDEDDDDTSKLGGLADLTEYWESVNGMAMDAEAIPSAEDLYDKLVPYALNPDNSAVTQAVVFWACGAGSQEHVDQGVDDYLLVVVPDFMAPQTEKHVWGEPTWEWTGDDAEGYTAASASFVCQVRDAHKKTAQAKLVRTYKDGANVYTATATLDGKEYTDTKAVENGIDKNDLKAAISAATDDMNATAVSDDGQDVPDGAKYASEADRDKLVQAVATARGVVSDEDATQPDIDAATDTLNDATALFDDAKKQVVVDRAALEAAITDAEAAMKGVEVSDDGKDVSTSSTYVTAAEKKSLDEALDVAQAALKKADATQAEIDAAAKDMAAAGKAFADALKSGLKKPASKLAKPDPAKQVGSDGTALGSGASAAAAEKAIAAIGAKSDKDPKGTVFGALALRSTKQAKSSVTLKWNKVKGAKSYVVYGNACGKGKAMERVKATSKNSLKVVKAAGKKLKKGTYYKFIVVALDKSDAVVSTSKIVHIATKGGKAGNYGKVTVKAGKKLSLKKGKAAKLGAEQVKASKKLKVKKHAKLRYESSDPKTASVSAVGKVKAKAKGTCYVYAYTQSGTFAKVKVTVK